MQTNHLRYFFTFIILFFSVWAWAYSPSYYAKKSTLASGHWVKIEVDTTGVYELSYETLKSWGFQNPEKVAVFGFGAVSASEQTFDTTLPDDIVQTPSIHTSDGRMVFYAEGPVRVSIRDGKNLDIKRNHYTRVSNYLLGETDEPVQMVTSTVSDNTSLNTAKTWHYSIDFIEHEVQNPGKGGVFFHGPQMAAGDSTTFKFKVRDFYVVDDIRDDGTFKYQACINNPTRLKFGLAISDNVANPVYNVRETGQNTVATKLYVNSTGEVTFHQDALHPLDNVTVSATIKIPEEFEGDYVAIDNAYAIYPRKNIIPENGDLYLNLLRPEGRFQGLVLYGANDNTELWNVTNSSSIYRYEIRNNNGTYYTTIDGDTRSGNRALVAFDPYATHPQPRFCEVVANQNYHGVPVPDMVVFTTRTMYGYAKELADIHAQKQGLDVLVLAQEEAFNEFGGGNRTPAALRRVAKMFYDRDPEKFKYVMLYGPSSWDNRFVEETSFDALVNFECELEAQARESATNYTSDTYFGMLADDYNPDKIALMKSQVSVGRLSVRNDDHARKVNAKIRTRLSEVANPAVYLRMLKLSDKGDNRGHLDHSELIVDSIRAANKGITITHADMLLFPKKNKSAEAKRQITRALTRGQGYMYYSGHGDPYALTEDGLMDLHTIATTRYTTYPVIMFSSCDAFPFDREGNTLAENNLAQQNGGAIGVIGACRAVYMDHNKTFSIFMGQAYATARPGDSGADVLRNARNNMIDVYYNDVNLGSNTLCFNYCGDPAVPMGVPDFNIAFAADVDTLTPLSRVNISGNVLKPDSTLADTFNGTAVIEVYDAPYSRASIINTTDDGKESLMVYCDEELLGEFTGTIKAGKLSGSLILPQPTRKGNLRFVVSAIDPDTELAAAGIQISPSNFEAAKEIAQPVRELAIEDLSVDAKDYIYGNVLGSNFTVHATIEPGDAGLTQATSGIRSKMSMVIDDAAPIVNTAEWLRYGANGKYTLAVPLENLLPGRHTITLTAVDNYNRTVSESIYVTVDGELSNTSVLCSNDGLARRDISFELSQPESDVTYVITNKNGDVVTTLKATDQSCTWNLKASNGTAVADGAYEVHANFLNDGRKVATKKASFIIAR